MKEWEYQLNQKIGKNIMYHQLDDVDIYARPIPPYIFKEGRTIAVTFDYFIMHFKRSNRCVPRVETNQVVIEISDIREMKEITKSEKYFLIKGIFS